MKNVILLSIAACLLAIPTAAQQNDLRSFGIFYDEDQTLNFLALKKWNEDRNYTLGVGFYLSCPKLHHNFLFWPLTKLNAGLGLISNNDTNAVRSILLANGSFTPANISATAPIRDDRPYGSITHLQFSTDYVNNTDLRRQATAFSFGVIGTRLAEWAQTTIHRIGNWREPKGWPNQVSEPWEPTFLVSYREERLLNRNAAHLALTGSSVNKWGAEMKYGGGAALGYYTEVHGLFSLRAGRIDRRNWTYETTPLAGNNKLTTPTASVVPSALAPMPAGALPTRRYNEYYLFAAARPYATLYNALLNGQFVKSKYTLGFRETQHFLLEFDAGAGITFLHHNDTKSVDLKFKISGHSPEFKTATRRPRWHYYGGIDAVFNCW